MKIRAFWDKFSPYFVDIWQYLIIVLIFVIALIFLL